ncbi:hypothetical protein HQ563_01975 [bacterium]|nr:hypothetical protein [bacterium]
MDMCFQFAPGEAGHDVLTARTELKEGANLMVTVMPAPRLIAHEEKGWMAVKCKVVKPRPRVRFSVKRLPVTLVTLLNTCEGKIPVYWHGETHPVRTQ